MGFQARTHVWAVTHGCTLVATEALRACVRRVPWLSAEALSERKWSKLQFPSSKQNRNCHIYICTYTCIFQRCKIWLLQVSDYGFCQNMEWDFSENWISDVHADRFYKYFSDITVILQLGLGKPGILLQLLYSWARMWQMMKIDINIRNMKIVVIILQLGLRS